MLTTELFQKIRQIEIRALGKLRGLIKPETVEEVLS